MTTRPRLPERLEKTLARVARDQGIDQERLRRWVSFLAICGVLERAASEGILGGYYLKGGVAMELRFAQRARATKDLDLVLNGDRGKRLRSFEQALKLGFDEFSFRLKAQAREMDRADTVRVEVAIQYRTRAWQTVEVDLGPAGTTTIDRVEPTVAGIHEMGVPVTSPIRCIGLSEQVAQKLHACTAPHTSSTRARDVLDILLIETLGQLNYPAALAAALRVFDERGTHEFPPDFIMPALWRPELEALAAQLSFPVAGAAEIETAFRETVRRIATAILPTLSI
ncbi:nucleotidyl transferase AbiEii/AbiGii toxin family protein [Nevskia soli]|uniref:nucleotidyl transferase AbiEii/AbiGii toxin family protein n=1 Tax=Nevskia soli TaxID=418856 RepID=UPI0015D7AC31|nr:nucleotidyl transferase AbiEii/AbiGii toxin family protein [Nevskia soli]